LTAEGYAMPTGELLSVTGGIRGFSSANGFIAEAPFGTNATGCPNFRAKFVSSRALGATDPNQSAVGKGMRERSEAASIERLLSG
jgi:hypothetical protein